MKNGKKENENLRMACVGNTEIKLLLDKIDVKSIYKNALMEIIINLAEEINSYECRITDIQNQCTHKYNADIGNQIMGRGRCLECGKSDY